MKLTPEMIRKMGTSCTGGLEHFSRLFPQGIEVSPAAWHAAKAQGVMVHWAVFLLSKQRANRFYWAVRGREPASNTKWDKVLEDAHASRARAAGSGGPTGYANHRAFATLCYLDLPENDSWLVPLLMSFLLDELRERATMTKTGGENVSNPSGSGEEEK
jgi:hypothetical protein